MSFLYSDTQRMLCGHFRFFHIHCLASCDLLHSWNSFLEEDLQMEFGRRPAACLSPLFLSPSLPATLPPSLPHRRIQLTSQQGNVGRRSCSLPVSLTLPSRRREGTSSHKLTEDLAPPLLPFLLPHSSFSPSIPPSIHPRPSPSLPSYRVGGDKEPAHKLLLYLNPSPSLPPSLPPSFPP